MFYGVFSGLLSTGDNFVASEVYNLWQGSNTKNAAVKKVQQALVDIGALPALNSSGKSNVDSFWGPTTSGALAAATGEGNITLSSMTKLEAKLGQKAPVTPPPPPEEEGATDWVKTALWIGVPVIVVAGLAFALWPKAKKRPALENRRARRNRRSKKYVCPVCGERSHNAIACDCATV